MLSSSSPSQQNDTVDVVIIGSGPTGLMLAAQLTIHGIKFRIFDKLTSHTTQSRALVVHSRSLEIFQQLGIADKTVSRGEIIKTVSGFFGGVRRTQLGMQILRTKNLTKFPFVLVLEQSKTEELLEQFLLARGIEIERQCELIDFVHHNENDTIECTIRDFRQNTTEGNLIKVRTKYLCGCDGAHSRVRENLHLSFPGSTYGDTLFVLDCHAKFMDSTKQGLQINVTKAGLALFFPLKDDGDNDRWRVMGTVPYELLHSVTHENRQLEFKDIEPNFSKRLQRNIQLYNPAWMSVYRTHHRYVEKFSHQNKYFLLGDAAHIHSPVGGQGMNTGLQDAFNLSWKLAYTIQGKTAGNELLETYSDERITVAKNLVQTSDRAFSFMTSHHWLLTFLRLWILPYVLQFILFPLINHVTSLRNAFFKRLSMIGIQYRQSQLSVSSQGCSKLKVQAGDRLPYVCTHSETLLSSTNEDDDYRKYFHFLILLENEHDTKCFLFVKFLQNYYSHLIRVHVYQYSEETKEIFHVFGVNRNSAACFLIRPDLYISYCSTTFDTQNFDSFFSKFFRKQK